MPLGSRTELEPRVRVKQPLFERVQDWIFKLDVGEGVQWFRLGLFCLLVLLVILLYTGTQFYGLRDAEAMEAGQLARNLWKGRGYVTRHVRPLQLWYMGQIGKPALDPKTNTQPELWMPPLYPLLLSWWFHVVQPDFEPVGGARTLGADRAVMAAGWLFFLAGMGLTYLLARELFDRRVAVMSVFLFLVCNPLLESVIAGLPLAFLAMLFAAAAYGLLKAERWHAAGKPVWWVYSAVGVSALAVGMGTLTQYAFASVLLPLVVYVAVSFPKRWHVMGALCVLVFALVLTPWVVRNWKVSRTFFGLARYSLAEGTGKGTREEIRPGQLQRSYVGAIPRLKLRQLARTALMNAQQLYEVTLKEVGANYLIAFFLVALLHRFRQEEVFRLRRFVFWSLLASMGWLSVTGLPARNFLIVFVPLIIIYGVAFFYVMFERLQFRTRLLRKGVVGLFAAFNTVPFLLMVLPPGTTVPYPPYWAEAVAKLGQAFREEELLASDIPWAVAWYADRSAVWLPFSEQDYIAINDEVRLITGIYLTEATLQQAGPVEMLTGYQHFWVRLYNPPPPPNFPLQSWQKLPIPLPQAQHILLSNRPR
jgi:hypothetical protein